MVTARQHLKAVLFLVLMVAACKSYSDDVRICPDRIRLTSGIINTEDIPSGYKPLIASSSILLTGANMFDGPPEEGAVLKPFLVSANGAVIKWILDGPYENGKWLSCDYADGLIRLVTKAKDATTTCVATIKASKPHNILTIRFDCK